MLVRDLMEMLSHVDQDSQIVLRCDGDVALQSDDVCVENGVVAFDAFKLVSEGLCDESLEMLGAL